MADNVRRDAAEASSGTAEATDATDAIDAIDAIDATDATDVADVTNATGAAFNHIFVAGIPGRRFDIRIADGRFTSIAESASPPDRPGEDLWISPGVIDLHTHLAWTDFHHADQAKRSPGEIEALQVQAFEATLRAGVTTARDAGGLSASTARRIREAYGQPLKVAASGESLGGADAGQGTGHLERRVKEIADGGASWIKIFATGGLGSPPDKVLEPLFSREELFSIVRAAHANHRRVLVHAWGGAALDWAIEAGADSVEHGIYMTGDQAGRLAQAGISFVPTAAIYRIAAEPDGALALDGPFRERAARAADAHPAAIRHARREGVRIGFGTDFATPALHGRNLEELDVLIDCGLTREEAWRSATEHGADILGYGDRLGRIEAGYTADAILFNADPYRARNAEELRGSIVSVLTGEL
ncbi:amidohydrolase family protein [Cohnella xylanilytica]|uniref:Amidohydrolase family protein n=1 Tax=Cohnella xylanilytica TaxID=557555 RepID=A0A841UAV0_9BACL|nr:amidohydrolase family protein [Cohnella xylanilytica]